MRVVFMGTPDFAVPTLRRLAEDGHDIVAVYTRAPAKAGRGMALRPSPVHALAETLGAPVLTPASLKGPDAVATFAGHAADVAVVVAYGMLLPQAILDLPRHGCLNLHGSLLPRWRGAAPIQRAVMAGDAETGVMVMRMDEGLDTGPVLMAERVPVGRKTSGDLTAELSRLGADLMVRALGALERGAVQPRAQAVEGVTYAKKILKEEARIDWHRSAHEIDCQIRGLAPFPGAFTEANGERLKILYAEPVAGSGKPGALLDDALTVACGEGALRLSKVQRPGKSAMSAAELLKGFALPRGTQLL